MLVSPREVEPGQFVLPVPSQGTPAPAPPAHRLTIKSPVRKTSELRGTEALDVPATQSAEPDSVVPCKFPMLLMTHVLADARVAFGIASGAPNRHEHA